MKHLIVAISLLVTACGPSPLVLTSPSPVVTSLGASPSAEPSASPSPTPSPSPTFEKDPADDLGAPVGTAPVKPRITDAQLAVQAQAIVEAIALPKGFPYRIQLYDAAGPYHAAFGGFDSGTAVLLLSRDSVRSNIVVHEYGHAWHERFMGYDSAIWLEYGKVRGYTDQLRLAQNADNYLDDWRERFAVDFQWAFNPDYGGKLMPSDGYWSPVQLAAFRQFVITLPVRAATR